MTITFFLFVLIGVGLLVGAERRSVCVYGPLPSKPSVPVFFLSFFFLYDYISCHSVFLSSPKIPQFVRARVVCVYVCMPCVYTYSDIYAEGKKSISLPLFSSFRPLFLL